MVTLRVLKAFHLDGRRVDRGDVVQVEPWLARRRVADGYAEPMEGETMEPATKVITPKSKVIEPTSKVVRPNRKVITPRTKDAAPEKGK